MADLFVKSITAPPLLLTTTEGQEMDPLAVPGSDHVVVEGPSLVMPMDQPSIWQPKVDERGFEKPTFSMSDARSVILDGDLRYTDACARYFGFGRSDAEPRLEAASTLGGERPPALGGHISTRVLRFTAGAGAVSMRCPEPGLGQRPASFYSQFDPAFLHIDPVTGKITYRHNERRITDLSHDARSFYGILIFLKIFGDADPIFDMMLAALTDAKRDHVRREFTINIEPDQNPSDVASSLIGAVFRELQELIQEEVVVRTPPFEMSLGGDCKAVATRAGNELRLDLYGFLPEGRVWKLVYDVSDAALKYTRGEMRHIDPYVFVPATKPAQVEVRRSSNAALPVLSLSVLDPDAAAGIDNDDDLASELRALGEPCANLAHNFGEPHLGMAKMGQFIDADRQSRTAQRLRDLGVESVARFDRLQRSTVSLQFKILTTGDPSLILKLQQSVREIKSFMARLKDTRFALPGGTMLAVWNDSQRLEIISSAGASERPSLNLYEDIVRLNSLMDSRRVCYTIEVSDEGQQIVQIFVYNQDEGEWQYFAQLHADLFGMRPLTPDEEDKGSFLGTRGFEHTVNATRLAEYWEEEEGGESEIDADGKELLKRARLLSPRMTAQDAAMQAEYRMTVVPFLARVMQDQTGLIFGLNGADAFGGSIDPRLQYLSFTYSADVENLIIKYMAGTRLSDEERAELATRFQFSILPVSDLEVKMGILTDQRLLDLHVGLALGNMRGRVAQLHERYQGQADLFTVLLDLDPGRSGGVGSTSDGSNDTKKRKSPEARPQPGDGQLGLK